MARIEQIDITSQRSFEMIPKIGNQLFVFGDATETDAKLSKLKLFYKEIMVKAGWNTYSVINVQYRNQVVAKIKGAEDITADSLRTLQIMQLIAERAQREANDSLQTIQPDSKVNTVDSTMIQQSIQRDDNEDLSNTVEKPKPQVDPDVQPVSNTGNTATVKHAIKPVVKPAVVKKESNAVTKPQPKTAAPKKAVPKPKAAMPKRNEY